MEKRKQSFYIKEGDKIEAHGSLTITYSSELGKYVVVNDEAAEFTVWDEESEEHIPVQFDENAAMFYLHHKELNLK
jgi:tRNA splicing ligase